jgi:hypothetical protein
VCFALAGLFTQTRSFDCFCSVVLLFEIAFLISGLLSAEFLRGKERRDKTEKREETKEGERDDELAVCSRSFGINEGVAAAARADLPPYFGKLRRRRSFDIKRASCPLCTVMMLRMTWLELSPASSCSSSSSSRRATEIRKAQECGEN